MPGRLILPRDVAEQLEDSEGESFMQSRGAVVLETRAVTDALMDIAKAAMPEGLGEDIPFFWQAHISTDAIDTYGTRMMKSSLDNYAAEAAQGRAFMNSHNWEELPVGYSLTGKYAGSTGGDKVKKAVADFYTVRNYNPTGRLNSDELIRGMQRGLIRDVSIGWLGGRVMCNICGRDMWWDWNCWHMPGLEYALRDDEGNPTGEKRIAEGQVEDAHLAEVSAVFDGACPGALVSKVYREVEERRVTPEAAAQLERRYRMRLPDPIRRHASATIPSEGRMAENGTGANGAHKLTDDPARTRGAADPSQDVAERALRFLRDAFGERGIELSPSAVMDTINALADEVAESRRAAVSFRSADAETPSQIMARLSKRVDELTPLAADGKKFREAEVKRAVDSAVRAFGVDTDRKEYEGLLDGQPIERIIKMGEQWEATARTSLKGGRGTLQDKEGDGGQTVTVREPDAAFAG